MNPNFCEVAFNNLFIYHVYAFAFPITFVAQEDHWFHICVYTKPHTGRPLYPAIYLIFLCCGSRIIYISVLFPSVPEYVHLKSWASEV